MVNKIKIWLRFLGFPKKDKCLIRKVSVQDVYNDIGIAQSWLMPGEVDDPSTIKNYMTSLPVWNHFMSSIKLNDELWYYRFPDVMWKNSKGSHGYVILRSGKYYDYFEIAKN